MARTRNGTILAPNRSYCWFFFVTFLPCLQCTFACWQSALQHTFHNYANFTDYFYWNEATENYSIYSECLRIQWFSGSVITVIATANSNKLEVHSYVTHDCCNGVKYAIFMQLCSKVCLVHPVHYRHHFQGGELTSIHTTARGQGVTQNSVTYLPTAWHLLIIAQGTRLKHTAEKMMQAILPKVSVKLQVHQQTKSQQMPHRHLQQANEIDVGA